MNSELNYNQSFPQGYGEFPYFIIRAASGIFIQIPVIRVSHQNLHSEPQYHVQYTIQGNVKFNGLMYDDKPFGSLMDLANNLQTKISFRFCLVLSPCYCIYFENGRTTESEHIPKGGILHDQHIRRIGFSELHYKVHDGNSIIK